MSRKLRSVLALVALAGTLAGVFWASGLESKRPEIEVVGESKPPRAARGDLQVANRPADLNLERLRRQPSRDPGADLFTLHDFRPAPPAVKHPSAVPPAAVVPPVVSPASPPPQAPPLPFTYMGRLAEGDSTTVFLTMGERSLVVRPGDVIDGSYRIDKVTDAAVVLTYLPLTVTQTLPIGAK